MRVTIFYRKDDGKKGVVIGNYNLFGIDFDEKVIMFDRVSEFNKIKFEDILTVRVEDNKEE